MINLNKVIKMIILCMVFQLLSCNNDLVENNLQTQPVTDELRDMIIYSTPVNEIVVLVKGDMDQNPNQEIYVLQTNTNKYAIDIPIKFKGSLFKEEGGMAFLDFTTGQKYVLSTNTSYQSILDDKVFFGYGLSIHEGSFDLNEFLIQNNKTVFDVILAQNERKLPLSDIKIMQEDPPKPPCDSNACSTSWMMFGVQYTCSVSCNDGFTARCDSYRCRCVACDDGGDTPVNQGGGSAN